jgi:hypothetical protein
MSETKLIAKYIIIYIKSLFSSFVFYDIQLPVGSYNEGINAVINFIKNAKDQYIAIKPQCLIFW